MERLIILGARQHAKVITVIAEEFYAKDIKIIGFLDDNKELWKTKLLGYPILGGISDLKRFIPQYKITSGMVGISNRYMKIRERLFGALKEMGLKTPSFIHTHSYISRFAAIGEGVVINPGVIINAFAKVGNNSVIYSNSTVEHESALEDNVYVGPGVNFSSNVRVGRNTFIGAGVKIIPDMVIGSNVIIGAGSVITKDIPCDVSVAGIPARIINSSCKSKL